MDIRDLHVIDVDSHLTEPADLWTSRAPAKYADRVPHVVEVNGIPTHWDDMPQRYPHISRRLRRRHAGRTRRQQSGFEASDSS